METSVRSGRAVSQGRACRRKFTAALRSQLLARIVAMAEAGASREEIAKSLGISQTSLRRWTEAASAVPTLHNEASAPVAT